MASSSATEDHIRALTAVLKGMDGATRRDVLVLNKIDRDDRTLLITVLEPTPRAVAVSG